MAAIDQYAKLYLPGASLAKQRIQRGAYCASGVEHIIGQHDVLAGDGKSYVALLHHRLRPHRRKIVSVQADVKRTHRHRYLFNPLDHSPQALRQKHTATPDADDSEVHRAVVLLNYF